MADSDDTEDEGAAARAFADLHAEVAVMRKAVDSLPALIEELAAPDYAPSFGAIAKSLANVEARLAGIEGHPALKVSPEAHGQTLTRFVAGAADQAARALRNEADAVGHERRALAEIVGHARAQDEQRHVQNWTIALSALAGFVLFPALGAFAPGGGFLAMLATGNFDRWQAGVSLMQAGDPVASRTLAAASRIMNANSDALKACSDAAQKAGKEQKCGVVVRAMEQ